MLEIRSEIISKFKGVLNGVEVNDSGAYSSIEWFLYKIAKLEFKPELNLQALTKELIQAAMITESRDEYFDRGELENNLGHIADELEYCQKHGVEPDIIPYDYFEEAVDMLQDNLVIL